MFTPLPPVESNLGAFNIVLNAGTGLQANPQAMAAFERSAQAWEAFFSDPIIISIDADFAPLSGNTIGQASTELLEASFNTIRNQLVADSAFDPDDQINAFLPAHEQFTAFLPPGFGVTGNIAAAKSNLKAMGFAGLDEAFGASDATITFNSLFAFDFDPSNGVTAGQTDFQTVATHEIGHALGFFSVVDEVDFRLSQNFPGQVSPRPLDLFRFRNNDLASDPETPSNFTINSRDLTTGMPGPGTQAISDFVVPNGVDEAVEHLMSTGVATGDGRQASHWKDDAFTGVTIGVLDPTLAPGTATPIKGPDVRALDLIGYDNAAVPEPGSSVLLVVGMMLLGRRRSRSQDAIR